jgi:hypothetical protein
VTATVIAIQMTVLMGAMIAAGFAVSVRDVVATPNTAPKANASITRM